jgi:hypothetical protein
MPFDIDHLLVNEANRIGPDIYHKSLNTSPWLKLCKKATWPDEMGTSISVMTYQRSLPTSAQSWSDVGFNTGSGSNCVPSATVVEFAQTLRNFNLQQTAIESPKLCINDLRFTMKRKEQLSNIFRILTENTSYAWIERYRSEYSRLAENKVLPVSVSGAAQLVFGTGGNFPNVPVGAAPSRLTQGTLDRLYMRLIRDGAGNNPFGRENGRPQFAIITSSEQSNGLILENAAVREDYRYSTKVSELLSPLGVERAYKGFYHLIDDFAPRWNWNSGTSTWVRVPHYVRSTTGTFNTGSGRWDINPDYLAATYEDTYVFHTDVLECMIPTPITAPGGNTKFDPVSYMGEFKWLNIRDTADNPDGTIGYFRAVLSSGSKPVFPEWGYVIRHARCDSSLGLLSC